MQARLLLVSELWPQMHQGWGHLPDLVTYAAAHTRTYTITDLITDRASFTRAESGPDRAAHDAHALPRALKCAHAGAEQGQRLRQL